MQKAYKPGRIIVMLGLMVAILTFFVSTLYRIQIYEPRHHVEDDQMPTVSTRVVTLPAARGNIYDRNGILLISGRPALNITLHHTALQRAGGMNDTIHELIIATMDAGIDYRDTFPVTRGAPFSYVTNMSNEQTRRLNAYLEFFGLDPEISATDLLAWMREHYRLDYTVGISAARLIIGVRYELEIRRIIGNITPYIFAQDIDTAFASLLAERNYIGVNVDSTFVREHHTIYAAHLLGYIGPIPQGRLEEFLELGYPMDALVGITGVEAAFEHELRGIPGRKIIRTLADGTVVDVTIESEPIPGNHVYLTIDIGTQIAAEHALRAQIHMINAEREVEFATASLQAEEEIELELIPSGAVAVTDVNTGEVLAAASYPTFNPLTLAQDIGMLIHDERQPMFNRAINGRFIPGSTFKMVTGFAGLRSGLISSRTWSRDCTGVFDRYYDIDGSIAHCWFFLRNRVGHGWTDLIPAIEYSCNIYFLDIGALIGHHIGGDIRDGAEFLGDVAMEFGLGVPTGIEINESIGLLSTPTARRERFGIALGEDVDGAEIDARWFAMDTAMTAFGQGDSRFTPIQLANYTATIANGGTLRDLTILSKISNPDFQPVYEQTPKIRHTIDDAQHLRLIQEGMIAASSGPRGTANEVFRNYHIRTASKTGTAQVGGQDTNDGAFVIYAPVESPEIAIAITVEKGGSGSAIMDIARMIFDHHFRGESSIMAVPYGELIP